MTGDWSSGHFAPEHCGSDKAKGRITCGLCPMMCPPKDPVAPLPTAPPPQWQLSQWVWAVSLTLPVQQAARTAPVLLPSMAPRQAHSAEKGLSPTGSRPPSFFGLPKRVQEVFVPLVHVFSHLGAAGGPTPAQGLRLWHWSVQLSSVPARCSLSTEVRSPLLGLGLASHPPA